MFYHASFLLKFRLCLSLKGRIPTERSRVAFIYSIGGYHFVNILFTARAVVLSLQCEAPQTSGPSLLLHLAFVVAAAPVVTPPSDWHRLSPGRLSALCLSYVSKHRNRMCLRYGSIAVSCNCFVVYFVHDNEALHCRPCSFGYISHVFNKKF